MADQNVPPRRPRDDRGWDGRQHPTSGRLPRPHAGHGVRATDPPTPTTRPGYPAQADPQRRQYADGYAQPPDYPAGHRLTPRPAVGRPGGPRPRQAARHRRPAPDCPTWTTTTSRRRVGRRRALAALGGPPPWSPVAPRSRCPRRSAACSTTIAGGRRRRAATAVTDGTAARPSGQQPSTVRTYTEQNESYMGSRAGAALKKNAPTGGRVFGGPAEAAAGDQGDRQARCSPRTRSGTWPAGPPSGPPRRCSRTSSKLGIDDWIRAAARPGEDRADQGRAEARRAAHPQDELPSSCATARDDAQREGRPGRPGDDRRHHRPADLVGPPALRGDGRLLERLPARRAVLRRRREVHRGLVRPGRHPQARAGQLRRTCWWPPTSTRRC